MIGFHPHKIVKQCDHTFKAWQSSCHILSAAHLHQVVMMPQIANAHQKFMDSSQYEPSLLQFSLFIFKVNMYSRLKKGCCI